MPTMNQNVRIKLSKAQKTLKQTLQTILEINRRRKRVPQTRALSPEEASRNEELKVLNKIAAQQARLIRHYENALNAPSSPRPFT